MAVCDKWVALKIVEFCFCVACVVAKRISQDDETRLALLLQKLSREWSLLTSVTWDSVGGAFADAVYGGYVIITFGLILARVFREVPRGRRVLEGIYLGFGMLFFLVLGGLELASLDSVPYRLTVNASVLGALSLVVAALFLIDLMGPRTYFTTHHSQTDLATSPMTPKSEKKVSILTPPSTQIGNGLVNGVKDTGQDRVDKQTIVNEKKGFKDRPKDLDLERGRVDKAKDLNARETRKEESSIFETPKHGYMKFADDSPLEEELERSKYGSLRTEIEGGNYIRLSDPLSEVHYEQELAKFNEWYYKKYLESVEGKYIAKEKYLPEPQNPIFAKVMSDRMRGLYGDSPTYEQKRLSKSPTRAKTVATPTLQQLEDYLKGSRTKRGDTPGLYPMTSIEEGERDVVDTDGRASGTPSDRGYVQYTAGKWPDKREVKTPRHSPT